MAPPQLFSNRYFFGKGISNYADYTVFDNDGYWRSTLELIEASGVQGRMLDVGCAFGYLLKRAAPYFDEVYGVDVSPFAIRQARRHVPQARLAVVNLDCDALPFPDDFFDCITALDVLEHTSSLSASLVKLSEKLKPGGYAIFAVPLRDGVAGRIRTFFDKDETHVSVPKREEFLDAIERAGLTIIKKRFLANMKRRKLRGVPSSLEVLARKG